MQGGVPTLQFSHRCRDLAKCSTEWIMPHPDEGPFSIKLVANCEAPLQITSDYDTFVTICLMDEGFWNVRGGDRMQKIDDFWRYTVAYKKCENCPQNQGTCKNQRCTKGRPHLELQFQGKESGVMIPGVPIQGGNRTLDDLFVTKIGVSNPINQLSGRKVMRLVALANINVNNNNNNNNNISTHQNQIVIGQTNTFKVMSDRWVRQLRAKEAQQFANECRQISSNTIQMQQPIVPFDYHSWLQCQQNISSSSQEQQQQQYSQQLQQQYLLNQSVDNNNNFGIQQNLVLLQQQQQYQQQSVTVKDLQQQVEQLQKQIQLILLQNQQRDQRQQQIEQKQQQSDQILLQIQQNQQSQQSNNNWHLSDVEFDQIFNELDSISDFPDML